MIHSYNDGLPKLLSFTSFSLPFNSFMRMFRMGASRLFFAQLLMVVLQITADSKSNDRLVCSGSVPLGTILSSNGAYYTISSKPESASGQCDCASSTGHVSCQVAPKFPINTPQGPAICQSAGQTTCAISSISLCFEGKPVGSLDSKGAFSATGQSEAPDGFCQCDSKDTSYILRCPTDPRSASYKQFARKQLQCSATPDCKGF